MNNTSNGKVYYSFDEIGRELFGLKPLRRVTKDKQKLESQREKFLGICPYCKQPTTYIYGTNAIVCKNAECKGKRIVRQLNDGTEIVEYKPFIKVLSDKGTDIGMTIFEE
jgi:hypothetical protein